MGKSREGVGIHPTSRRWIILLSQWSPAFKTSGTTWLATTGVYDSMCLYRSLPANMWKRNDRFKTLLLTNSSEFSLWALVAVNKKRPSFSPACVAPWLSLDLWSRNSIVAHKYLWKSMKSSTGDYTHHFKTWRAVSYVIEGDTEVQEVRWFYW